MKNVEDFWKKLLGLMGKQLNSTVISTWFDEVIPVALKDDVFLLYCPNEFKQLNIERFFLKNVMDALLSAFSREINVRFLSADEYRTQLCSLESTSSPALPTEKLTFSSFIVGESNRIAYNAAQAVAAGFNEFCNPLVIYGRPGLGKTHLLNAIATAVKSGTSKANIVHLRGDEFTNDLVNAIKTGRSAQFRSKYRTATVFLMDDIQFIAGKTQTQEEFYNTFTTLYEKGCSIVLTMDRPPKALHQLEERLVSRFEGGLMVEIHAPELDTRLAIIRQKAKERDLSLSEEDIQHIAETACDNVRHLEGMLNKIKALTALGRKINIKETSLDLTESFSPKEAVKNTILEVSSVLQIREQQIMGKSQCKMAVTARQVVMYILFHRYHMTEKQIGKELNRDRSTVTYALKAAENKLRDDSGLAECVARLLAPE